MPGSVSTCRTYDPAGRPLSVYLPVDAAVVEAASRHGSSAGKARTTIPVEGKVEPLGAEMRPAIDMSCGAVAVGVGVGVDVFVGVGVGLDVAVFVGAGVATAVFVGVGVGAGVFVGVADGAAVGLGDAAFEPVGVGLGLDTDIGAGVGVGCAAVAAGATARLSDTASVSATALETYRRARARKDVVMFPPITARAAPAAPLRRAFRGLGRPRAIRTTPVCRLCDAARQPRAANGTPNLW